ncbi:hypothetical protein ACPPVT_18415 [Angustibacter sp. McL0619]|uniref:hypothetical protein n=1 Tax=Angustibacter sp. McL0619 TaxID=3415676 RepID=UPI003CF8E002
MTGGRGWTVSWAGVVAGAVSGVLLTLLFVTAMTDALSPALALMPEFVGYGLMLLLVGCLRAVCGMWAASWHRRRYEVESRTEFIPTAALAGVLGWAGWFVLNGVAAHTVGGDWVTVRSLAEVLRWVAEMVVGSLLLSPQGPVEARGRSLPRQAGSVGRTSRGW